MRPRRGVGGTRRATGPGPPVRLRRINLSPEGVTRKKRRRWIAGSLAVGLAIAAFGIANAMASSSGSPAGSEPSTTPIKHLVVIFQENESFDHYFGTYPNATNPAGEPSFTAKPGTPSVNGLGTALLTANPNSANPKRLDRGEALTCDMDHGYADEQKAADAGLMDKFVQFTAGGGCADKSIVMDYYDGNTVTGLWNLAQNFSLSDDSFDTQFGPSTVGALNLISGETHGAEPENLSGSVENGTVMGDPEPAFDACGKPGGVAMKGKNVGTIMSERGISWGWFQGGFAPTEIKEGKPVCGATHLNVGHATVVDYSPHHNPFEYYKSTANPLHRAPESEAMIGHNEPKAPELGANHEYDMSAFDEAVKHENLPAVSYLKAPEYQDGHPGYSDPLDEQAFIAEKLDELEHSNQWSSTAVVIAYDDSDGWYDHVMSPIVTPSKSASDFLNGAGVCGNVTNESAPADRCGYGPRLPLLVISPYAKRNYVDNTQTDQSSILKFVEENWQLGRIGEHEATPNTNSADYRAGSLNNMFNFAPDAGTAPKVFLDPSTGEVIGEEGGEAGSEEEESGHEGGGGSGGDGGHGGSGGSGDHHHEKVHCTVDGHGHKTVIVCTVEGGSGRGAVRYRIERGNKVLGTSSAPIKGSKATGTVTTKSALAGKYTLLATVSRTDGVNALSQSVKLPGKGSVDLH
jgi:phospholipase C